MENSKIVVCRQCGTKNRIPKEKAESSAKCGRCHQPLAADNNNTDAGTVLTLRCRHCHAKNRVPVAKLFEAPKCGRCAKPLDNKDVNTGRPVLVTDANFDQTVIASPLPVLLYSWAPWCSVCSTTGPMVERLAFETKGKIRIGKLDTQANPQLASRFNILSVPSFFIFDAGQLKKHIPGAVPKHDLMLEMANYL
jgi:thioredoxin 2